MCSMDVMLSCNFNIIQLSVKIYYKFHPKNIYSQNQFQSQTVMKQDIEMHQINEKNEVIGTQIFDPNMPSNIDFDQKIDEHEDSLIHPDKNLPPLNKVIIIGDHITSFKIMGQLTAKPEPYYQHGVKVIAPLQTHPVKIQDEEGSPLKKLWSSIVGHSNREMLVRDGFIYFFQKQAKGLQLRFSVSLANLFKMFVDPQQQRIRLVIRQQQNLTNKDLYPQNFILVTEMINQQLNRIGLYLHK